MYKSHSLYSSKTPTPSLEIMAHYDDVEVCNPLGSRGQEAQASFVLLYLGNIPPKYQSSLGAIQLFAVLKTSFLEKYGCNQVLQQFMEDLSHLESEQGIDFVIVGSGYKSEERYL